MAEIPNTTQQLQHFEFVKQIRLSGKYTLIDTRPIFIAKKKDGHLFVSSTFEKAVLESNADTIHIPQRIRTYDIFTNTQTIVMKNAMDAFGDTLIDLNTYNGREEAKVRFKCLANFLATQTKGERGKFSTEHATIIGWMKLSDNNIYTLYIYWNKEPGSSGKWYCHADSISKVADSDRWKEGKFFLKKCTSEKQKIFSSKHVPA